MRKTQYTFLILAALFLVLGGCHPTPAELLDEQRRQRDDSIATALAAQLASEARQDSLDNLPEETPEIMTVDSGVAETLEIMDTTVKVSRLQQVLDVMTDTALFE